MKQTTQQKLIFTCISIMAIFLFLLSGCQFLQLQSDPTKKTSKPKKPTGPVPLYYDFGDVLIPGELKLETKSSFVFKSEGLAAGILIFKGRVNRVSLIDFFKNNMAKDNWQEVSSFKSQRTILLFSKQGKRCVINITEDFNTIVEIWVMPTNNEANNQ